MKEKNGNPKEAVKKISPELVELKKDLKKKELHTRVLKKSIEQNNQSDKSSI
jgi:hypothetical protein